MNKEELASILKLHSKWLKNESGGIRANLTGANLTRADLKRANLEGANLRGADLTRADLREANLTGADLRGADLTRADLREANLTGANLTGAYLEGADLTRANLEGADLEGAIKIPIYCKWTFGITDNEIHIGCKKMSIDQWDKFFEGDEIFETPRNTEDFKRIRAVYEAYKYYLKTMNNE